jgi:predicted dehydrogenase
MKVAFLGTGYVAEQYANSLPQHPELGVAGAYDHNRGNLESFTKRIGARAYASLDDLLADPSVHMVINLTNPRSHFELNARCLEAGKHVYSEKPLAMTPADAQSLVELARRRGVHLSSAPCSVLSETAQTLWRAIRDGSIGKIRLLYANFDDGMIAPKLAPWEWRNESGVAWPAKDEFEVGCTYQHAGYVLSWLCAMFGPARTVTAFASVQLPDKGIAVDAMAPDFTVGGIEFADGIVARVTCGLVAPRDKSITVVGDSGTLFVGNVRDEAAPVMIRRDRPAGLIARGLKRSRVLRGFVEQRLGLSAIEALQAEPLPQARTPGVLAASPHKRVDFLRGPSDMAEAIAAGRPSRLSAEFGAHLVEIVEALQYPERFAHRKTLTTTFAPMAPLPWAG